MAYNFKWTLFSNASPIISSETSKVITLFKDTTTQHSIRDFDNILPSTFLKNINNPVVDPDDPKHPNRTSWIKVSCAFYKDHNDRMVIAIVYHYIKHRNAWSVSVGFDQNLLPAPKTDDTKYLEFADLLGMQIKADFGVIDFNITSFIMIDDVAFKQDGSGNETATGFEEEGPQRKTKIGELIWLAKDKGSSGSTWVSSAYNNPDIKGYATKDDGRICVTTVSWKKVQLASHVEVIPLPS